MESKSTGKQFSKNLTLRIGRQQAEFDSYRAASEAYQALIAAAEWTGTGGTGPIAPKAKFVDEKGKVYAFISYNGRVWLGKGDDWREKVELIYCPSSDR